MTDVELTRALERSEIANEHFRHASHLHVAWVYLAESSSMQQAANKMRDTLRRFAAAAADRDRTEADARSATAQARFTGLLVAAMPAGAAVLAELLDPGFVGGLFSNPASATLLAIAAALQLAGFAAIRRLSRVTVR